jgi:hypothetical protein
MSSKSGTGPVRFPSVRGPKFGLIYTISLREMIFYALITCTAANFWTNTKKTIPFDEI